MTPAWSRDQQLASVAWALNRMVEIRKAGQKARFRITWIERDGRREYRLEVRRDDGRIERPPWPFPLAGSEAVEESDREEESH